MIIASWGHIFSLTSLQNRLAPSLSAARSHENYLEITSSSVDKGTALSALLTRWTVLKSNTIAVGDGRNDIPLFEAAAISVAMSHAPREVREAATHISAPNTPTTFAEAIAQVTGEQHNATGTWTYERNGRQ